MEPKDEARSRVSLSGLLRYFLRLGAVGFGGPIALAERMERDLVAERGWITRRDYLQGLALAELAPGPLAAQLAMYLGYVHSGVLGATLAGVAFILPSFLMVVALAAAYVRFGGLPWIQGAFYGIGAAVVAVIARAGVKLAKRTIGSKRLLWILFAVMAVVTAWTGRESAFLFVLCGLVSLAVQAGWGRLGKAAPAILLPASLAAFAGGRTLQLFIFFCKSSLFVFGSGLAIVPFLRGGLVHQLHWLSERQFLDAVAVAMITPGPVVITAGFIGYLVSGFAGACASCLGVFLPVYLFVVLLAPWYARHGEDPRLFAFVEGVTSAAVGALSGAVWILGREAIRDVPTALIALLSFAALARLKASEPLVILLSGAAGWLLFRAG